MAMAAQLAQAQEAVRKLHMNAPAAAAAAAAAAANLHAPPFMPDVGGLQHALLGQERSAAAAAAAALGAGPSLGPVAPQHQPGQPSGYSPDQLNSLMASICQV